jgi:AcrR family transcriptional regulator
MKNDKTSADDPRAERELRRREEIHTAILHAAERIIMAKTYSAMTMADVAREAGLSKATLYKYIPNKGLVLFEIVSHHLDVEGAKVGKIADSGAPASAKLRAIVAEIVGFQQAKSNIARMLMMDRSTFRFLRLICGENIKTANEQFRRKLNTLRQKSLEFSRIVGRVIEEGTTAGEFRSIDPMDTAFLIDALLVGVNHPRLWESGMVEAPADQLAEKIFDFIYSGLRKRKGES